MSTRLRVRFVTTAALASGTADSAATGSAADAGSSEDIRILDRESGETRPLIAYFLMLEQRWAQRTLVFIVDGIPKDAAGDRVLR